MIVTRATLKSSFPAIVAGSEAKAAAAVKHACEKIETRAKERSRVDTGNMRAGWEHQMTGAMEGMVFNLVEYTVYNDTCIPNQCRIIPS